MEPGESGIKNAAQRGLRPLICSTLEQALFPHHTIPAIGVFDVIEHVENDLAFMESMRAHLVPGGKLYLTVPAFRLLWSAADDEAGHFRRYTLKNIGDKLRTAGFDVLYETYIFCALPIPAFLLRTLPYRLGLRRHRSAKHRIRELRPSSSGISLLLEKLLSWELNWVKRRKSIAFGGSCLIVAAARK